MSNNTIKDRIEREARELITNLYGHDVGKMRRQLIAFHAKMMNATAGADSFIDPLLLKVVRSKYSTVIVAASVISIAVGSFAFGMYI